MSQLNNTEGVRDISYVPANVLRTLFTPV